MLISYAQNFEDVILWRALKEVKNGFYIDVGAQDPVIDSVSRGFYEQGWRGVHIEPTPQYSLLLRENRPDETILQYAIGSSNTSLIFYSIPNTGLSTPSEEIANQHLKNGFEVVEIAVNVITLDEVLNRYSDKEIHWLKIDVEGHEEFVLKSWTTSMVRPWILLIESTLPLTQVENYFDWESIVISKGYEFVYFDGLNRYYLHETHLDLKERFRVSPNLFDHFMLSGTQIFSSEKLNGERLRLAQSESHELRVELERQLHHLELVQSSLSWKITAPLRWIKGFFLSIKSVCARLAKRILLKLEALLLRILTSISRYKKLKNLLKGVAKSLNLEGFYKKILIRFLLVNNKADLSGRYLQIVQGFDDLTPNGKTFLVAIDTELSIQENGTRQ